MKSGRRRNERTRARIGAVISACMLVVVGLPACTGGALPAARSSTQDEPLAVHQQNNATPAPLDFTDETSKSLPAEENEEPAGVCSDALYFEEPMASGYVQVSEGFWQHCNEDLAKCGKACRRKRSDAARSDCYKECNKAYTRCLQLAGIVKATFNAFDAAWSWIKDNKAKVVGAIVIIGGIAYIVSTGGSGALILIPLGA